MIFSNEILLTKEEVIASFKDLPDKVSAEDIIEKILFLKRLEIGLQEAEAGNTTPHEEVMAQLKRWKKEKLSGYQAQEQK